MGKSYTNSKTKRKQLKKQRERKRDYVLFLLIGLLKGFVYYVCCLKYLNPVHIIKEKQKKLYYTDENGKIPFKPRLKDRIIDLFQTGDQRRRKLIAWVKYKIPGKHVVNFTTSWNDGIGVCALLQSICPGICPGFHLLKHHNLINNCRLGIRLANQCLNIPENMISPEEMAIPDQNTEQKIFQFVLAIKIASERVHLSSPSKSGEHFQIQRFSTCTVKGPGLNDGVVGRKVRFSVFISDVFELFKLSINIRGPRNEVYSENIVSLHQSCENSQIPEIRFNGNDLKSLQEKNTEQLEDLHGNTFVRIKNIKEYGSNVIYNAILFTCQCIGEGSFQMTFIPVSPGIHTLSIRWQDRNVQGSPYKVKVYQPRDLTRRSIKDATDKRHFFDSLSLSSIDEKSHSIDREHDNAFVPKLEKIDSVSVDDEAMKKRANKSDRFTSRMRKQYTVTKRRVLRKIITKNGEEIVIQESPTPSISRQSSLSAENSDNTEDEGKNYENDLLRASPSSLRNKVYNKRRLMASERSSSFSPGSSFESNKVYDKKELLRVESASAIITPSVQPDIRFDDTHGKEIDSFEKTFTQSIDLCDACPDHVDKLGKIREDDTLQNQDTNKIDGIVKTPSRPNNSPVLPAIDTFVVAKNDTFMDHVTNGDDGIVQSENETNRTGFQKPNKLVQQVATDISSDSGDSVSDCQKSESARKSTSDGDTALRNTSDVGITSIKVLQSESMHKSCFYISDKAFSGSNSSSESLKRNHSISSLENEKSSLAETKSLPLFNDALIAKHQSSSEHNNFLKLNHNSSSTDKGSMSLIDEMNRDFGQSEKEKGTVQNTTQKRNAENTFGKSSISLDNDLRRKSEIDVNILEDHLLQDSNSILLDYKDNISSIELLNLRNEETSIDSDSEQDLDDNSLIHRRHSTGKTAHKLAMRTSSLQDSILRRKDIGKRSTGLSRQTSIKGKDYSAVDSEKNMFEPNMEVIYEENKMVQKSDGEHSFEDFITINASESKSPTIRCDSSKVYVVIPKPKCEKCTQVTWTEILGETGHEEPVNLFKRKVPMNVQSKPSMSTISTYLSEEERRSLSRSNSDELVPLFRRTRSLSVDAGIDQILESERFLQYQMQELGQRENYDIERWIDNRPNAYLQPPVRQSTVDTIDSGIAEENNPGKIIRRSPGNLERNLYGHQLVCRRPYRGRIELDQALIESGGSDPQSPVIDYGRSPPFTSDNYNHPRLCRKSYQGNIYLDPVLTRSGSFSDAPTAERDFYFQPNRARYHDIYPLNQDSFDYSEYPSNTASPRYLNKDSSFSFSDSEINYSNSKKRLKSRSLRRTPKRIREYLKEQSSSSIGENPDNFGSKFNAIKNRRRVHSGDLKKKFSIFTSESVGTETENKTVIKQRDNNSTVQLNVPMFSVTQNNGTFNFDESYTGFGVSNSERNDLLSHLDAFKHLNDGNIEDDYKKENIRRFMSNSNDDLSSDDDLLSEYFLTFGESESLQKQYSPLNDLESETRSYTTSINRFVCSLPDSNTCSALIYTPECNICLSINQDAVSDNPDVCSGTREKQKIIPRTPSYEAVIDIPVTDSLNTDESIKCRVEGSGLTSGYVGVKNNFQVWTENNGNGSLSVHIYGPRRHSVLETSIVYTGDNLYEVIYEVTHPGYYIICVEWSNNSVPESPFLCKVTY